MTKIIVVGGGIAGMTAAHTLRKAGADVEVLEAGDEPGGRMRSHRWQGAWLDLGAEFITSNDEGLMALADDLGLAETMISYPGDTLSYEVWRDGTGHPLDYTNPVSVLRYGAMSPMQKLRILRLVPTLARQFRRNSSQPWEPWRAAWADDESVEQWLGRIAPEFLEYVVQPTFELYCSYRPQDLSRGMFAYLSTIYRNTKIFTFPEGLGQLTRALGRHLDVRTGVRATRVAVEDAGVVVDAEQDGRSQRLRGDGVVVAVPGTKVADLVDGLDAQQREFFSQVSYTPAELPFFTTSRPPTTVPERVFYPRSEDPAIAELSYRGSSTDPDVPFLRVSMQNGFIRDNVDQPDELHTKAIAAEAARRYPEVAEIITDGFVSRWREGLPMFGVGYLRALERFVTHPPTPRLVFAGDYLAGPGTGPANTTGRRAAEQLLRQLA